MNQGLGWLICHPGPCRGGVRCGAATLRRSASVRTRPAHTCNDACSFLSKPGNLTVYGQESISTCLALAHTAAALTDPIQYQSVP